MKKILALALALIMSLSMASVAFAAGGTAVIGGVDMSDETTITLSAGAAVLNDAAYNGVSGLPTWIYINGGTYTIDLGGNTFTMPSGTHIPVYVAGNANVTFTNGAIEGVQDSRWMVVVNDTATVNFENITVKSTRTPNGSTICQYTENCTTNLLSGANIIAVGSYAAVEANGVVNIYDGAVVTYDGQTNGNGGGLGSAVGTSGIGVANIYGGIITSTATGANKAAVSTNSSGGTINVYGGEIEGETAIYAYTDNNSSPDYREAYVNVYGGEVSGKIAAKAEGSKETQISIIGGTLDTDAITTSGSSTAVNIASTVTKTPATEAAIESAVDGGTVNIDTVVPATNPGQKITIRTGIDRSVYKVKSYDFTTGTKGYQGASYIDEVKIEKNGNVVIILKDNYKLATDKTIKGEVVLVKKADKNSTLTIPVEYLVANEVTEVYGSTKAKDATDLNDFGGEKVFGDNCVIVMDEDGGYVKFNEEMLSGVVKMNKEEKTFLNVIYGGQEETVEAIEEVLGEEYLDEAIIEYYEFETRAFKNEVAFSYEAYEDDPHYFYLYNDGKLTKIEAVYNDDEEVEAWEWTAIAEGTIIVTDVEIVLAAEETKNPDTGANDVVGMASALAVVSLVAAGAICLKK